MRTIGLIGGMSWESTAAYYRIINEIVNERLGGFSSADLLLRSVNFAEIEKYQREGRWDKCAEILAQAAESLEKAGADFVLICSNTPHIAAPAVQARIHIPLIHIAEAAAAALKERNIKKTGLLGTKYTMTLDFYKDKLAESGIEVLIPQPDGIDVMNSIIYGELCHGKVLPGSKEKFLRIIGELEDRGALGIILGCTEIGMLIRQQDTDIPLFDTTRIHAEKAALLSIGG